MNAFILLFFIILVVSSYFDVNESKQVKNSTTTISSDTCLILCFLIPNCEIHEILNETCHFTVTQKLTAESLKNSSKILRIKRKFGGVRVGGFGSGRGVSVARGAASSDSRRVDSGGSFFSIFGSSSSSSSSRSDVPSSSRNKNSPAKINGAFIFIGEESHGSNNNNRNNQIPNKKGFSFFWFFLILFFLILGTSFYCAYLSAKEVASFDKRIFIRFVIGFFVYTVCFILQQILR